MLHVLILPLSLRLSHFLTGDPGPNSGQRAIPQKSLNKVPQLGHLAIMETTSHNVEFAEHIH